MATELSAKQFAADWIAAWNSHNLDTILSHYSPDVVLTSPAAAKILDDASGTVRGNTALRNYFKLGLEVYPNLHFDLQDRDAINQITGGDGDIDAHGQAT